MTAAVVRHDPEAVAGQEQQLVIPGVGSQRPSVAEDDRATGSPILEEDLRTVLRGDFRHGVLLGCAAKNRIHPTRWQHDSRQRRAAPSARAREKMLLGSPRIRYQKRATP